MTEAIVAFLRGIGIDVVAGDLGDDTFLPGILTRDGRLVFEAERLTYPGDLLHEAGTTYAIGVYPGAAALEEIGLTLTGERAVAAGVAPYPHMIRWVRR